jgi:hypothetical protein
MYMCMHLVLYSHFFTMQLFYMDVYFLMSTCYFWIYWEQDGLVEFLSHKINIKWIGKLLLGLNFIAYVMFL